jgi:hypothetical protein
MPSEDKFTTETMVTLIQTEGKDKHRSFEMRKNLTQPYRTVYLFKYQKIFQTKIRKLRQTLRVQYLPGFKQIKQWTEFCSVTATHIGKN